MTPIMSSLGSSSAHCGRVPDRGCLRWLCSGRASCQGRVRGSGVVGCGWGGEALPSVGVSWEISAEEEAGA
jgi:hypothetical protein